MWQQASGNQVLYYTSMNNNYFCNHQKEYYKGLVAIFLTSKDNSSHSNRCETFKFETLFWQAEIRQEIYNPVVFWRRSCLSKVFSLMIMGILLQLLMSTWISFHTNLLSVNRQLALPLRTVYFFSSASLSTYSLLTETEFIAIDHVIVDVLDEYLSAQVVLQMQVTAQ